MIFCWRKVLEDARHIEYESKAVPGAEFHAHMYRSYRTGQYGWFLRVSYIHDGIHYCPDLWATHETKTKKEMQTWITQNPDTINNAAQKCFEMYLKDKRL